MIDIPEKQRSGSFLSTIPGILTALAGIITAIGGLYFGFGGGTSDSAPAPIPVTSDPPSPPPTEPIDPLDLNIDNLQQTDTSDLGDELENVINDCTNGFLDACTVLLNQLIAECSAGFGLSCDVLYLVSPIDSDYEWFGATCGARFPEPYPGWCAEL